MRVRAQRPSITLHISNGTEHVSISRRQILNSVARNVALCFAAAKFGHWAPKIESRKIMLCFFSHWDVLKSSVLFLLRIEQLKCLVPPIVEKFGIVGWQCAFSRGCVTTRNSCRSPNAPHKLLFFRVTSSLNWGAQSDAFLQQRNVIWTAKMICFLSRLWNHERSEPAAIISGKLRCETLSLLLQFVLLQFRCCPVQVVKGWINCIFSCVEWLSFYELRPNSELRVRVTVGWD